MKAISISGIENLAGSGWWLFAKDVAYIMPCF